MGLLALYGINDYKIFYDRVRNFKQQTTPLDELRELLERLSPDRVEIALQILKQVAEGRRIVAV